jgi:hypothetical protein
MASDLLRLTSLADCFHVDSRVLDAPFGRFLDGSVDGFFGRKYLWVGRDQPLIECFIAHAHLGLHICWNDPAAHSALRGSPVPVPTSVGKGGGRTLNRHPGRCSGNPIGKIFCVTEKSKAESKLPDSQEHLTR